MRNVALTLAAATFATVGTMGSTHAADSESIWEAVNQSSIDAHTISISVTDGVATLAGDVDSHMQRAQLAALALDTDGITEIINLVTTN